MILSELLQKSPCTLPVPSSGAILNTRIRYARNLEEFPFPIAIKKEEAIEVWRRVNEAVDGCPLFKDSIRFYLPDYKKIERIFLIERRIISPDMLKSELPSGAIISGDGRYSILVNEEDHLRIGVLSPRATTLSEIREDVAKLDEIEDYLNRNLKFAYSKANGYLTSCPTNLGGGLRISALFHLVGLVLLKESNAFLESVEKKGLLVRGYYGEKSRSYGDVFQIASGLSSSVEDTVKTMAKLFGWIESAELKAREMILLKKNIKRYEDIIYRGFGIIQTARLISFEETVSILSLILLGKYLGFPLPVDEKVIYELMNNTQPAHIQFMAGRELNASERDEFRAEYIRRTIGGSQPNYGL